MKQMLSYRTVSLAQTGICSGNPTMRILLDTIVVTIYVIEYYLLLACVDVWVMQHS